MNFIRHPTYLPSSQKNNAFCRALTVMDRQLWIARYEKLCEAIARNPFTQDILLREYKIEHAVGFMIKRYHKTRVFPSLKMHPEFHNGLEFLHIFYQVRSRSSASGQRRLDGMLRDGLNKNRGVASVAFELATATHFVMAGCSVAFRDVEGHPGADLVVEKSDTRIEVECKHVSGDIGYPVHTAKFRDLILLQKEKIDLYSSRSARSIALLIKISGKLHNNEYYYDKLSSLIATALRECRSVQDGEGNEVVARLITTSYHVARWNAAMLVSRPP